MVEGDREEMIGQRDTGHGRLLCGNGVRMLMALAAMIAAMLDQAATSSLCPRTSAPTAAASTGLTLMNNPNALAGTRRSVNRSARNGTAEERIPAATAAPSAPAEGVWCTATPAPMGRKTKADSPAAAAVPCVPGMRCPMERLRRM